MTVGERLLLLGLVLVACGNVNAEPCSMTILVESFEGAELSGIPVEIIGDDGSVVAATRTIEGVGRICDYPFGRYRLIVNRNRCNAVILEDITIRYTYPETLRVVLNSCGREGSLSCIVEVKTLDGVGSVIAGADVGWVDLSDEKATTDEFGRAHLRMRVGKSGMIYAKGGRLSGRLSVTCDEIRRIQEIMVLSED